MPARDRAALQHLDAAGGLHGIGESTAQGAARETLEESGARIELGEIYTIIDVPQIEQVHVFYLAQALGPELDPGPESLEARYYDEAEIPWDDLAFRTVSSTLRRYLKTASMAPSARITTP